MDFFGDDKINVMFQNHIRRVVGFENTQAKVMIDHYRRAIARLRNDLLFAQDDSFTEAKLQTTIAQLEIMLGTVEAQTRGEIDSSLDFATEQGVEDVVKELNIVEKRFNGINQLVPLDAIIASTKPSTFLFNNYTSSLNAYNASLRSGFQDVLTQGMLQRKSLNQVIADMSGFYQKSEFKLHRIVRTELHNIYNVSKMSGMETIKEKYVPDLKKSMIHPMDERTGDDSKVLAHRNPIIDIDQPFKQKYNGRDIVFMAPPNRPNDRAILVPYRTNYDN